MAGPKIDSLLAEVRFLPSLGCVCAGMVDRARLGRVGHKLPCGFKSHPTQLLLGPCLSG